MSDLFKEENKNERKLFADPKVNKVVKYAAIALGIVIVAAVIFVLIPIP